MEDKKPFKVRDIRHKEKLEIDDMYINGYAKLCGVNSTLVYCSLCRHANFYTQEAFPSQELMSEELGISERSVRRGLEGLEKHNIISVQQIKDEKGKFGYNVYTLIDKSDWKTEAVGQKQPTGIRRSKTDRRILPPKEVNNVKVYKTSLTNVNEGVKLKEIYGNPDINELFDFFKKGLKGTPDGTIKENRRFAYLLIQKFKKDYPDKSPVQAIKWLILFALKDDFHSKTATSFKYLYRNSQRILQSAKSQFKNPKYIKI